MSASPDTGNLADVLRQLVALAEHDSAEEDPDPSASEGNRPEEGTEGKASDTKKVQPPLMRKSHHINQ